MNEMGHISGAGCKNGGGSGRRNSQSNEDAWVETRVTGTGIKKRPDFLRARNGLRGSLERCSARLADANIRIEQRTVWAYLEGEVRHGSKKREMKCACSTA